MVTLRFNNGCARSGPLVGVLFISNVLMGCNSPEANGEINRRRSNLVKRGMLACYRYSCKIETLRFLRRTVSCELKHRWDALNALAANLQNTRLGSHQLLEKYTVCTPSVP